MGNEKEKRMIESYEVKTALHIGGKQLLIAEDEQAVLPFMVADCTWDNPLGVDVYSNVGISADYLEVLTEFINRVSEQVKQIEAERAERGISSVPLTVDDCVKGSQRWNYENQLVVIKPEKLTPSVRTADRQLLLATGGAGCNPESSGTTVFCTNLFTGQSVAWKRNNVAGVIDPAKMPEWAAEKLVALQKPVEKESILARLEAAKNDAARGNPPTKEQKHQGLDL